MNLSERQAHILLHILQDTLKKNVVGYLSTTAEFRNALLEEILSQQDDKPIELKNVV